MINDITLKFGNSGSDEKFKLKPGSITILVGPNNSGKSLFLREVESFCQRGISHNLKIIDHVQFDLPEGNALRKSIEEMKIDYLPSDVIQKGHTQYGRFHSLKGTIKFDNHLESFLSWRKQPNAMHIFVQNYVPLFVSHFVGKSRFALVENRKNQDLKFTPKTCLGKLFQDDNKRKDVRDLIYDAFKKYFVIDATSMNNFEIRLSDVEPPSSAVERGWEAESVKFHKNAKHISEFSDGVQAFTGLMMTAIAGEEKIMLVDEPEAFLHPPLIKSLGKKLSEIMSDREGNLIVATHSSSFVMGCLQSGKPVNIVRLTYDHLGPAVRQLNSDEVSELFRNPLLRSTGIMESLFHSSVIVTEGDTDRAFYNEINERLNSYGSQGIQDCLFLNAQNKQTIHHIIEPLKKMGVLSAGILDIDFIKCGGKEFADPLKAFGVPIQLHESFSSMRRKVKDAFDKPEHDMKKKGITCLSDGDLCTAKKFIKDLSEYGIFIVPCGEVESWLKFLECEGHGPRWLIEIFKNLGSDPSQEDYIKPTQDDVWEFIRLIQAWIKGPRSG